MQRKSSASMAALALPMALGCMAALVGCSRGSSGGGGQADWVWTSLEVVDCALGQLTDFGFYELQEQDAFMSPPGYEAYWFLKLSGNGESASNYLIWGGLDPRKTYGIELRGERLPSTDAGKAVYGKVWVVRSNGFVAAALDAETGGFVGSAWPVQPVSNWPTDPHTSPEGRIGAYWLLEGHDWAHDRPNAWRDRMPKWAEPRGGELLYQDIHDGGPIDDAQR